MNSRKRPEQLARTLLDEGLEHYGRGDEVRAVACWQRALGKVPGNAEALEYLEAAGVEPEMPTADVIELDARRPQPKTVPPPEGNVLNSPVLLDLIKNGRHEAALEMLYDARTESPNDSSLSRSVRHLKIHLARNYLKTLGGVDVVPTKVSDSIGDVRGSEEQLVHQLVDGFSNISDILRMSRFGQLPTLKALAMLAERGLVEVIGRDDLLDLEPQRQSMPTPAPTSPPGEEQPSAPTAGAGDTHYSRLFSEAMDAYFDRDIAKARAGLEKCCSLRPSDKQARHNLERLRALEAET